MIHDSSVQQRVEKKAGDAIKWDHKVFKSIHASPKRTAIIAEEIVVQWNNVIRGALEFLLGMEIKPRVSGACESLNFCSV